jgi:multisubunit Na+/H+ antiporter MnhB subunit
MDLLAPKSRPGAELDTDAFLLERATTEHEVAERKRDATQAKAAAVATLAAALVAILAAPAFDVSGLAGGVPRWFLLGAIVALLAGVGFAALALSNPIEPGDRPSRDELDNWTTHRFQAAEARIHARDFTVMYVEAAHSVREANEKAQAQLTRAVRWVGIGLGFLFLTMFWQVVL